MSNTDTPTEDPSQTEAYTLSIKELGTVLLKHYDLHEGKYQISIGFQIGVGSVPSGQKDVEHIPGAVIGVDGVRLSREPDDTQSPNVLDAAVVNPKKKSRRKQE